jgi:O-antigen/teichoic acid export membrane protein
MNKIYTNALWMITEKIFSIFGVIFVTAFVAKYIGPENFGKLAFATSIFTILQTFSMYGSENIIFQKTSKNKRIGQKIIKSTAVIRNVLYLTISIFIILYTYFFLDRLTFIFSFATCISIYFALHDVYTIYFNATLQAKLNTICNVTGLIISLAIRFLIPLFNLSPEWLALPIILVTLIPYLMRKRIFKSQEIKQKINTIKYRKYMLSIGNKLVLYSLSVAIFTKTSQIFLGIFSKYELGLFSVAMTLGTSFYFIFNALITSIMTKIYQENDINKNNNTISQMYMLIIILSSIMFISFNYLGKYIIKALYGNEYIAVTKILPLMVIVTMFSGLNTVAERYLYKFNAYEFLKKKTFVLTIFNIICAYILISQYAMYGAVGAMLITEVVSFTILNYFHSKKIILMTQLNFFKAKTYKKMLK